MPRRDLRHKFGPSGRAASDSWIRYAREGKGSQVMLIFDSTSSEIRRSMLGEPEQTVKPRGRRGYFYDNVRRKSGRLLLSSRFDTIAGRLTALFTKNATFGFGWVPVRIDNDRHANPGWDALANAWEQAKHMELLPMHQGEYCTVRRIIDEAAAHALGVSTDDVVDWRRRLALEPTITNALRTWLDRVPFGHRRAT